MPKLKVYENVMNNAIEPEDYTLGVPAEQHNANPITSVD